MEGIHAATSPQKHNCLTAQAMPQSSSMAVPQSGSYVMSSPYQQYQPQYQPYAGGLRPVPICTKEHLCGNQSKPFLGPPVVPVSPLFGGGVPYKIDYRERKKYPYSNLSTGGPRFISLFSEFHVFCLLAAHVSVVNR